MVYLLFPISYARFPNKYLIILDFTHFIRIFVLPNLKDLMVEIQSKLNRRPALILLYLIYMVYQLNN